MSRRLLRGHVSRSAEQHGAARTLRTREVRHESEVQNQHPSTVVDQNVPRLQITMQFAVLMHCGNSIGQDKRFLARYMPALHEFLHYKVVDVSSIKVLVSEWYAGRYESPKKQELHRALADIEESIEELKYYRKTVFVRPRRG